MTSRARSSRREAARARERAASRPAWLLLAIGGGLIVVAAIVAIVLTQGAPAGSSPLPTGATGTGSAGAIAPDRAPTITGDALPAYESGATDSAVGMAAPTVQGTSFDGSPVSISADGRPKVVLFLAHWCAHCQAEVPLLQDWIAAGGQPDDIDLVSVATSIDPSYPNYPPEAWLDREGWTVPVIVDPTDSVAASYGVSAFPFWTFIRADGTVGGRLTGELSIRDLETILDGLRAS
jgi:thiol-disulfide isomerase/thioredoxin